MTSLSGLSGHERRHLRPDGPRRHVRAALRPGPDDPDWVFAKDAAGICTQPLDYTPFVKVFKHSNIEISDAFLQRVVPAICRTHDFASQVSDPNDLVAAFLKINGDLKKNAEEIASFAKQSAPQMLWRRRFNSSATRRSRPRSPITGPTCTGQGDRSASPSASTSPSLHRCPSRGEQRQGRSREPARHLRQLPRHRPRPRRAVAVRTSRRSR